MTVIVGDVRTGVLAADTFCSSGYRSTKLFRTKQGLFGCAGRDDCIVKFEDWKLRKQKKPTEVGEEFAALQLYLGRLYIWGNALRPELLLSPFDGEPAQWYAIGSGGDVANGVLLQGGTVHEALRAAELFDEGTKGPFHMRSEKE